MPLAALKQRRCDGLAKEYDLLLRKQTTLRLERVRLPGGAARFQLDQDIAECEERLQAIEREMAELDCEESGNSPSLSEPVESQPRLPATLGRRWVTEQPTLITLLIEAPSGERYEADVPPDTRLKDLVMEFFRSQGWPLSDQQDQSPGFQVALVASPSRGPMPPLDIELDVAAAGLKQGDMIRIAVEGPHGDSGASPV